jgi:hypothetical protein
MLRGISPALLVAWSAEAEEVGVDIARVVLAVAGALNRSRSRAGVAWKIGIIEGILRGLHRL